MARTEKLRGSRPLRTRDWPFGSRGRQLFLEAVLLDDPPAGGWRKSDLERAAQVLSGLIAADIAAYAPYITATFGTRCGGRPAIPFTIADQGTRQENPLINTFLQILELPAGRFGIHGMLEILECPQVMARFDISKHMNGVIVGQIGHREGASSIRKDVRVRWCAR